MKVSSRHHTYSRQDTSQGFCQHGKNAASLHWLGPLIMVGFVGSTLALTTILCMVLGAKGKDCKEDN